MLQAIGRAARDTGLYLLGAWSFIRQVEAETDRPLLLAVTAALLGLPIAMRRDESTLGVGGGDNDERPNSP